MLDVADDSSVAAAAQAAPDVSILVNNAGVSLATPVLEAPPFAIRDELETNLVRDHPRRARLCPHAR
jgi:NAD(P)-dependent dehydrogenase (short-subunit alcohol dehydrogenase family)